MHDAHPGCVYRRCSAGGCPVPPTPAPVPPTPPPPPLPREEVLPWLRTKAAQLLAQATVPATEPGWPSLLQPGTSATYRGQWMRDGYYGIANGWSALQNHTEARLGVEFLFSRTRPNDGALPQMVSLSGDPSWVMWGNCTCQPHCPGDAGPFQCPWKAVLNGSDASFGCCVGKLVVMDSAPFAVLAAAHFVRELPELQGGGLPFFLAHSATIDIAMNVGVPLSSSGLPKADPKFSPARVGYGFADALGKSGEDLYMSVLFWDACIQLAGLHGRAAASAAGARTASQRRKHLAAAAHFKARADTVRANISSLWNDSVGAFRAASVKRSDSVDVWGSVYAGSAGLATPRQQQRIYQFLQKNAARVFFEGQAIELFPSRGTTYQDGGYWATPLDKILPFLARFNSTMACGLLFQVVESFRARGVWEWVAPHEHLGQHHVASTMTRTGVGQGAAGYIASIANTLAGAEAINNRCMTVA